MDSPISLGLTCGGSYKEYMVCYKVCSLVEVKEKLFNLKLDGLQKHAKKRKDLIFHPRVLACDYYISNDS
jgi:hypothetical protein